MVKATTTDKPIARIGRGGIAYLENGLTVYQDRVIEAALTTGFKNISKLMKFAKVPERNFHQWMKHCPVFQKAWEDVWGRQLNLALPSVVEALIKRVQKGGDPQAARLLLELAGKITQKHEINKMTDDELNARILQLQKEAGFGPASRGGSAPEGGESKEGSEGVRESGSLN